MGYSASETELLALARNQNTYMDKRYSTTYSKYKYTVEQTSSLERYTSIFMILYIILGISFLVILVVGPKSKETSLRMKGFVLMALILYPFCISVIEYYLLKCWQFVIYLLTGSVFPYSDYEYIIDYTYIPKLFVI